MLKGLRVVNKIDNKRMVLLTTQYRDRIFSTPENIKYHYLTGDAKEYQASHKLKGLVKALYEHKKIISMLYTSEERRYNKTDFEDFVLKSRWLISFHYTDFVIEPALNTIHIPADKILELRYEPFFNILIEIIETAYHLYKVGSPESIVKCETTHIYNQYLDRFLCLFAWCLDWIDLDYQSKMFKWSYWFDREEVKNALEVFRTSSFILPFVVSDYFDMDSTVFVRSLGEFKTREWILSNQDDLEEDIEKLLDCFENNDDDDDDKVYSDQDWEDYRDWCNQHYED